MRGYFDSSILLSILLNEDGKKRAWEAWSLADERFSSLLVEAEVHVVLRRYRAAARLSPRGASALNVKENEALAMTDSMAAIPFTRAILDTLRSENALTQCRSLDAIHLATALFVRRETGDPLAICSLDARMRETARSRLQSV
jgi:predicted nucleic acid-binding protein